MTGLRRASGSFPSATAVLLFLAFAGAANGLAFWLELFDRIFWVDKAMHAFTGFAVTLFPLHYLGRRLEAGRLRSPGVIVSCAILFGLAAGAVWEAGEWLIDGVYGSDLLKGRTDTVLDLIMDGVGAAGAGILSVRSRARRAN